MRSEKQMSAVHELKTLWSVNKNNNLHKSVSADHKNAFISVITKLYLSKIKQLSQQEWFPVSMRQVW